MVIQHIFSKNSCIRIQLFVSVKDALFHHSNFYLYSILFASLASIYIVFFSLVQLQFNKESFITPASIYVVLFLGMYRLSIRYPVSAGYLTIRYYADPVK